MKYYSFTIVVGDNDPLKLRDQLIDTSQKRVIFDKNKIICQEQLQVALQRADRAYNSSTAVAKTWGIEVLIHLAGSHQIKNAIELIGINQDTSEIGVIQENNESPHELASSGITIEPPTAELINAYEIGFEEPCLDIISKGINIIIDHE